MRQLLGERFAYFICAGVVIASLALFFFQLGAKPFWDYDEALYANVIQDTLQSGDLLTLKSHGQPYFDKPPLSFWLSVGIDSVFHHPEFSYRLTAAVSGILSIALVMLITYELSGSVLAAGLAGLMLLTTGPFVQAGRELRLDVPAGMSVLIAVYTYLRGLKNPVWFLGVGIALAIGFFFKNVIGLLSIFFFLAWLAVYRDFSWIKNKYVWFSGLGFLLVFLPWHVYETLRYGAVFWQNYLIQNTFHRLGQDLLGGSVSTKDYLVFFFKFAAPWSEVFILMLLGLLIQLKQFNAETLKPLLVATLTALAIFLLFAASSTKILSYLVAVYPFVAISLGVATASVFIRWQKMPYFKLAGSITACALFGFSLWMTYNYVFHIFPYIAVNDVIVSEEKDVADIISQDNDVPLYALVYDYFDTIEYYSGRREIHVIKENEHLGSDPLFLIVPKPYMDWHEFPSGLASRLTVLFKGQSIILYKFTP
jgi:4-amino-4-deoxy-L-arabinose transferase-like glycosyltransferase